MACEVADLLAGTGAPSSTRAAVAQPAPLVALAAACMAVAALLWGTSFFFIHIALTGFDAVTITVTRCLIGGGVVGLVALLHQARSRRRGALAGTDHVLASSAAAADDAATTAARARPPRRTVLVSVGAAGIFTALALLGVAVGQGTVASGVAGIVLGTVPVWTTAIVVGRARIRRAASGVPPLLLLALALGTMAGMLPALGAERAATTLGLAILLGAAMSHAASMVAVPAGVDRLGPIRNTSLVMLVAAVALSPALLIGARHAHPDTAALLALLELGILPTGLAYIAFFRAVAILGAPRATMSIYLIPLVALVTGTFIGGETLTAGAVAGGACALAAVAITVMPRRPAPLPSTRARPVIVRHRAR